MDFFSSKDLGSDYGTVIITKYKIAWVDDASGAEHLTDTLHSTMVDAEIYALKILTQVRLAFAPKPVTFSHRIVPVRVHTLGTAWN